MAEKILSIHGFIFLVRRFLNKFFEIALVCVEDIGNFSLANHLNRLLDGADELFIRHRLVKGLHQHHALEVRLGHAPQSLNAIQLARVGHIFDRVEVLLYFPFGFCGSVSRMAIKQQQWLFTYSSLLMQLDFTKELPELNLVGAATNLVDNLVEGKADTAVDGD